MKKILLFTFLAVITVAGFTAHNSILNVLKGKLDLYNSVLPYEKVYLQSDRPFYKPGDDIWFSVWITDGITNKPSSISEIVTVELVNPKGRVDKTISILANNGRTTGDFKLDSLALGGIYKLRAYTNWMQNFNASSSEFVKDIQVQDLALPKLRMKLDLERKAYGANDTVRAQLLLQTLENRPIVEQEFSFKVNLDGEELHRFTGKTDREGKAVVAFVLPSILKTNNGLLAVTIDYGGNVESVSRSIPITLNQVALMFFPEGGDLIADFSNNCAFKALNEFGKPADVEGTIYDSNHKVITSFKSYHDGMGAFRFEPKSGEKYYALLNRPHGIMQLYTLPEPKQDGYLMEIPNPMQFTNPRSDTAWVRVVAPSVGNVSLVAQVQGRIIYSNDFDVVKGENSIAIPLTQFPSGVAQITLFTKGHIETCERLVFVKKSEQLHVSISTDKPAYQPREKVSLTIKTTNSQKKPVSAQLALSVVDDKLLSMANDKSDNILSYLLLSSEVNGKIEEPSFYFNPLKLKADSAVDYLLLTQGWRRFTWKEIVGMSNKELRSKVHNTPSKRVVAGRINLKKPEEYSQVEVYLKSTGQKTTLNELGYYEFKNVDLTSPEMVVAVTPSHDTLKFLIRDYTPFRLFSEQRFNSGSKGVIKGYVVDKSTKLPLVGVEIRVKGENSRVVSDINGRYAIKVASGKVLQMSLMGYEKQEILVDESIGLLDVAFVKGNSADESVAVSDGLVRTRELKGMVAPKPVREFETISEEEQTFKKVPVLQNRVTPREVPAVDDVDRIITTDFDSYEEEDMSVDENIITEEVQQPFLIVEQMPEFPGGFENMKSYISSSLHYPLEARELGFQGKVYLQFVVDQDGYVSNIKIVRGIHPSLDAEAYRVVSEMPRWRPGKQGGRVVQVSFTIPIKFVLNEASSYPNLSASFNYDESSGSYGYYYRARDFFMPNYKSEKEGESRTDFRKTIYWNPLVKTDSKGDAKVEFYTSDELTTFKATVEGIDGDGVIGRGEHLFYTSKPISLDAKVPEMICFGDTISIPVTFKNSTSKSIEVNFKARYPSFLSPISPITSKVVVEANKTYSTYLDFAVLSVQGNDVIKLSLKSDSNSDEIVLPIVSKPNGSMHKLSYSGNRLSNNLVFTLPSFFENSLSAEVEVLPSVESSFTAAIQAMLREPHGCFEQASASTYPNVFILQYLKGASKVDKAVIERATRYISDGYKLLSKYETSTKGFEWFGHSPAHEGLTAFGLMEFHDMQSVTSIVDQKMYDRTLEWLLGRRDQQGGFNVSQGLYGFSTNGYLLNNAYLVYALSEIGEKSIKREFEQAFKDNMGGDDAYRLALLANTAFNLNDTVKATQILKRLKVQSDVSGLNGLKPETSITGSGGVSLSVETVSLYALALQKQKPINSDELFRCIRFILDSRKYGSFGSTQANVLGLKVLTAYYSANKELFSGGQVEVLVNEKLCESAAYNSKMSNSLILNNMSDKLVVGENRIDVNFNNCLVPADFQVKVNFYSVVPPTDPQAKVHLETIYKQKVVKRGDIMHLTAKITNISNQIQPMTVAIITIPSGFSFQPWQLKELQEKNRFDYYEIDKNQLHLYYRSLEASSIHTVELDLNSDISGIYHTAVSSCYLYYTPEYQSYNGIERLEIMK